MLKLKISFNNVLMRKAKDFAKADSIRQSLLEQGVVLEDTRQGTVWRRAD